MRLVEFTRDMRPYVKGETRVVPDDVAEKLVALGDAKTRDSVFDRPAAPTTAPVKRGRPYQTRKAT